MVSDVRGIPFQQLTSEFVAQLERLSATVILYREIDKDRPARMRVLAGGSPTDCLLYLWTITHGGKSRAANEQRIQATGLNGRPIPLVPGVRTLLGGWHEGTDVYAFWDPRRHINFGLKYSNSLQVTLETLEKAQRMGIATQVRPSSMGVEVVVAVVRDSLLWYVQNGLPLHNADRDAADVPELIEATPEDETDFISKARDESQTARRYDLVEQMRAYRDARFRPNVLRAYRYQCAVCQCALKLVDAAHIIPISYPQSTDDVTNGLGLCRLHHGAYDNGLLGVQSDYRVITNPDRESKLAEIHLDMGLESFKNALPDRISVPSALEVRPTPANLIIGLQARGFPGRLIA